MFKRPNRTQSVFRSRSTSRNPDSRQKPIGREQELEQIADAIRPIVFRQQPETVLICGKPGTGKTTCVNHVLANLDEQTTVKPVYINCWRFNTRSALLPHLLNQLGYPTPRKGKPADQLLIRLREWLSKNRSIVIALDEFDKLRDQTELVYDLHDLNHESQNTLGLLLISNTSLADLKLDPRSESRLTYHIVEFTSYTAEELVEILQQRTEAAFRPGTVSEEVIEVVAEKVAEARGDCRQAIYLLLQAGRIAERDGTGMVTTAHVEKAWTG
jgi:cell division control protein 6